jgi:hypothetical protein
MDIGLHNRGVHTQLTPLQGPLLLRDRYQPLMHFRKHFTIQSLSIAHLVGIADSQADFCSWLAISSALYFCAACWPYTSMEENQAPDLARAVAIEMNGVHSCFEIADEAYRRFRVCLLTDPPLPQYMPREWIPISNH